MIPPALIRPLAYLILALTVMVGAWALKARYDGALQEAKTAQAQVKQLKADLKNAEGNEKITIRYIDRIKTIEGKTRVLIKEVPARVTPEADARCVVPVGFVSVFNDSATGVVSAAPGNPDEPAAGIELSDVAVAVAENHDAYHKLAAQLEDLQVWVKEKLNENPPSGH